ncbi:hypothetical protein [Effusibacillus lacus]|nr:hypothetical protein [Effusibacillus lacus]TCS70978.1 hypothetical protein EDD64_12955 [Effusibacillus lacus]
MQMENGWIQMNRRRGLVPSRPQREANKKKPESNGMGKTKWDKDWGMSA